MTYFAAAVSAGLGAAAIYYGVLALRATKKGELMRATAKIDDKQIADMDLEICFKMKVSEWRDLMREVKPTTWETRQLTNMIANVLGHVTNATNTRFVEPKHAADPEAQD